MQDDSSKSVGVRKPGTYLSLTLLLLAVGCITVPFVNKAFHLDDTIFIRLAQEKLNHPLALGLPDYGFGGDFFSQYLDTHPPLLASFISLLIHIFGGASETGLHLVFIIFPALAAVSMFFLAKRFTGSPLLAAFLLAISPGFMVMSQSIMTDIPALAFWLAAIASYVYAVDREDNKLLILASIFLVLAICTTYQSFSLVPLLLLYLLLNRRVTVKTLAPLGMTLIVLGAIFLFYFLATGGPPKLSYAIGLSLAPDVIANKLLSTLSVVGGSIIFPVFLVLGLLRERKEKLSYLVLFAVLFLFFLSKVSSGQYTLLSAFLQVLFYATGILVIYRFFDVGIDAVIARPWKRGEEDNGDNGDNIFLILWICGVLAYSILLLPYASTRYLLPLFPPVVLMFVSFARTIFPDYSSWLRFAAAASTCTLAMGLATSIADNQLAGVYRDFGATYVQKLRVDNHKIWFAGEFGLRYYLEEEGAQYLTRQDNRPAAGDHVILSHDLIAYYLADDLRARLSYEHNIDYPSAWPFRVEDRGSQAGFYDNFHGNLPWSLSNDPIEQLDIYTVR